MLAAASGRFSHHLVKVLCGSKSTVATWNRSNAAATAKLRHVPVLPLPPLGLDMTTRSGRLAGTASPSEVDPSLAGVPPASATFLRRFAGRSCTSVPVMAPPGPRLSQGVFYRYPASTGSAA